MTKYDAVAGMIKLANIWSYCNWVMGVQYSRDHNDALFIIDTLQESIRKEFEDTYNLYPVAIAAQQLSGERYENFRYGVSR